MPRRFQLAYLIFLPLCGCLCVWIARAANSPLLHLSSGVVSFSVPTDPSSLHRIEVSTDLREWSAIATRQAANGQLDYTEPVDSQTGGRYFRAVRESDPDAVTGDHLATGEGDVVIHPVSHASFVLRWQGKMIYNDPSGGAARFARLPPADLVLISHQHGDHWDSGTLDAVRRPEATLVVPPDVFTRLTATQRVNAIALANGEETDLLGLHIEAVPAYNDRHPQGRDNGYVISIGGRRIYISGDTGPVPEMLALQEIDVAFLCMNVPFTMSVDQAAAAVRTFQPRAVYPYHYRNQDGSLADLDRFRDLVGTGGGVAVRKGDWY